MFLCGLGAKNEEQESKTARKMTQVKERGGGGEERKETFLSPPLSFIFWFSFHFSPVKIESPLLLRNQTETLLLRKLNFTSRESLNTDIHNRRVKQVWNIERFSSNKQFGWEFYVANETENLNSRTIFFLN